MNWKELTQEFISSQDILRTLTYLTIDDFNENLEYTTFEIKKRNGKKRVIDSPSKILSSLQKKILNDILYLNEAKDKENNHNIITLPINITAYRPNKSIFNNVAIHTNKNIVVKLDIHSFFNSIKKVKVFDVWVNLFSSYQSKLKLKESQIYILSEKCTKLTTYNNYLPQGAPTSGYLANLAFKEIDDSIILYCKKLHINYTRYSDDITISGNTINIKQLLSFCNKTITSSGFKINKKKTKIIRKNNRQIVTGVVVNKKTNIIKSYKHKLRQEFYYLKKYKKGHINTIGFIGTDITYLNIIIGKLAWIISIESKNKEFIIYHNELLGIITLIKLFDLSINEAFILYESITNNHLLNIKDTLKNKENELSISNFLKLHYGLNDKNKYLEKLFKYNNRYNEISDNKNKYLKKLLFYYNKKHKTNY